MTDQPDLIAWLRAQLDDDAAEIAKHPDGQDVYLTGDLYATEESNYPCAPYLGISKKRALAEVDAKRAMLQTIAVLRTPVPTPEGYPTAARQLKMEVELAEEQAAEVFAKLLALPYADRPGYRDEWRP